MNKASEVMNNLRNRAEKILDSQISPFWLGLRDREYGGFFGRKDVELRLHDDADKGSIMISRILYFFSEYYAVSGLREHLDAANAAYDFLINCCKDKENGGVFWSVTYKGGKADTVKHTYAQAFAIYALSSYYIATHYTDALLEAIKLFYLIEEKCTDENGYLESFDEDWGPICNDKLSENNVTAERTMNTLLHIFEAYSYLYRCVKLNKIEKAMKRILDIYIRKVYNSEKRRQEVFFDINYNSLIDLHSFGHDIESSWLIDYGCELLHDKALKKDVFQIDAELAQQVYNEAFDGECVMNESESDMVDNDRIWWVQCEAVVGFVNQWQKEGELKYLEAAEKVFNYIQEHLVDKRSGSEWLWGIHDDGSMMEKDVAGEWKCPYHNGRMCFEIIRRSR